MTQYTYIRALTHMTHIHSKRALAHIIHIYSDKSTYTHDTDIL